MLATALDRGLLVAPVSTVRDVVESDQLAARGYLQTLEQPNGQSAVQPGAFAVFSAAPIQPGGRAPRLNEHADEIRAETGPKRPASNSGVSTSDRPLEGVNVLSS